MSQSKLLQSSNAVFRLGCLNKLNESEEENSLNQSKVCKDFSDSTNFKLGHHIGSGFSGSVFSVQRIDSDEGEKLVVKVISTDEEILLEMARHEKRILEKLQELKQVA